jgi:hypothetical protein
MEQDVPDPADSSTPSGSSQPAAAARGLRQHHSVREFLFQLVTITAGVLIALGLEGLVGWQRDRALVREARSTIVQELSDNLEAVEAELRDAPARQAKLEAR